MATRRYRVSTTLTARPLRASWIWRRGGTLALRAAPVAAAAAIDDVSRRETPGVWILQNGHVAFHLARQPAVVDGGETWQINGPLVGWVGPDGVRRGGSRLTLAKSRFFAHDRRSFGRVNPARLQEEEMPPTIETSLAAEGPVFIRYRYALTLADGRRYTWRATLYAGEPLLRVSEEMNTGRDGSLELDLTADFPADLYVSKGTEPGNPERLIPLPRAVYRLGSLAPHHTQMQTCYPWLGFLQSLRPQGSYRGIGDVEIHPFSDVVAMMGDHPWNWEYPSECTYQHDYLWLCQPLGPGESEFTVRREGRMVSVSGRDLHGREFVVRIAYATDDYGAAGSVDGDVWRLDGRFAVHHREAGQASVAVLNGQRFESERGVRAACKANGDYRGESRK